jgi:hypothetical protein
MKIHARILAALAATTLVASSALAAPGGNGGGQGQGGSQGNGGNSAGAGSQGASTSAAANDKSTTGVAKALSVVGTTPASPQATLSLQAVLDKLLAGIEDDGEEEPVEVVEPVE